MQRKQLTMSKQFNENIKKYGNDKMHHQQNRKPSSSDKFTVTHTHARTHIHKKCQQESMQKPKKGKQRKSKLLLPLPFPFTSSSYSLSPCITLPPYPCKTLPPFPCTSIPLPSATSLFLTHHFPSHPLSSSHSLSRNHFYFPRRRCILTKRHVREENDFSCNSTVRTITVI